MPKPASTRPAYKMLTCIYLCRTLLFFAPYADFFSRKCKGLHNFLLANGGNLDIAIENSEKSILSKLKEGREHTYSEMADFFYEVIKK